MQNDEILVPFQLLDLLFFALCETNKQKSTNMADLTFKTFHIYFTLHRFSEFFLFGANERQKYSAKQNENDKRVRGRQINRKKKTQRVRETEKETQTDRQRKLQRHTDSSTDKLID